MNFSSDINEIRQWVQSNLSEKRYLHTLAVEREVRVLAKIFLPEKEEKLALAAVLHDITKENAVSAHLDFCKTVGIELPDGIKKMPKLYHAITGAHYARVLFGDIIIDDEIFSAIYYHTTGRRGMTLPEILLYLADYIEDTRTFEDCVSLREYFYNGITEADSQEAKYLHLLKTLKLSFDLTVKNLISENSLVDMGTVDARNYIIEELSKLSAE